MAGINLDIPTDNLFPCPYCIGEDEDCVECDGTGEVSLSTLRKYKAKQDEDFPEY